MQHTCTTFAQDWLCRCSRTTDDGCQPIAIGHLSDSGDLKLRSQWYVFQFYNYNGFIYHFFLLHVWNKSMKIVIGTFIHTIQQQSIK